MSNQSLITRYVRTLVKTAHETGWDAGEICRETGIDLKQALAGEGSYTASQLGLLVHHLSKWDDFLGQFPGSEKTGSFELMCELTMLSENLGDALDRGCRFYDMLVPQVMTWIQNPAARQAVAAEGQRLFAQRDQAAWLRPLLGLETQESGQ